MLANKQSEEINALKKRGKGLTRSRIASISISGGGLILGTVGYFLRQDDSTKSVGEWSNGVFRICNELCTVLLLPMEKLNYVEVVDEDTETADT